jgi:glutathione S-transferase
MYKLIVGTRNWSSWSLRPYLALAATGAPFEIVTIRLRTPDSRAAILEHSPAGHVPILKIGTFGVWDSLAICETLAERHPEAELWPRDPQRRALARAYACEMHSGFANLRDQLDMNFARRLPRPELRPETCAELDRVLNAWEEALAASAGEGGFLFGRFGIADCMYAPVVSRLTTYGVATSATIKTYMDRVWAVPGMQDWLRESEREVAAGVG